MIKERNGDKYLEKDLSLEGVVGDIHGGQITEEIKRWH